MKRKKAVCLHSSSITDVERGEILCSDCGVIFSEKIVDNTRVSHNASKEEYLKKSQTGPGISLAMYDGGLFTVIGANTDSSGTKISKNAKSAFYRLRKWDRRAKSNSATRNMGSAFTLLHGMKTKLGIPETALEDAAYLYRKVISLKLGRGRSIAPLIAASLYLTCRDAGIPRSLDDVAKAAGIKRKNLSRNVRLLVRKLGLIPQQYDETAFVTKISNNLGVSEKTKRDALYILKKIKENTVTTGKNPIALAAGVVHLYCIQNGEKIVQNKIAKVSSVSAVTIRNTTAEIKKILNL